MLVLTCSLFRVKRFRLCPTAVDSRSVMVSEATCADADLVLMRWPGKVPPDPDRMMPQYRKVVPIIYRVSKQVSMYVCVCMYVYIYIYICTQHI